MNILKRLWKEKKTRVWMLTSAPVLVFLLTASLVTTQVPLIDGTLDIVFGGARPITADGQAVYEKEYEKKQDALKAANEFNVGVVEEGITLLKNEEKTLPLASGSKVTVFGKNSVNLVYGGSGSSGGNNSGEKNTLYESLESAGFEVNPTMKSFYESSSSGSGRSANPAMGSIIAGFSTGETPISSYGTIQRNSYSDYSDAAIVVISRIGGEGFDLPRTMKKSYSGNDKIDDGVRNADDHYLQLDQNETDMLKEACDNFEKVVVVLNTSAPIELGFLDDPEHYAYNEKIKACLWMGLPGNSGVMALGKVLDGEVNPSGHTTDTYARDFKKDPSYANFGNNNVADGNAYLLDNASSGSYFVEYEEGIYVGYRYYETRGFTDGEAWYDENVVYPFGYGLSYTTFEWHLGETSYPDGANLPQDGEIEITVDVTNTGDVPGKDVVQAYYTAPYESGGIEKAHVVLADFAKTELIQPGETKSVTLSFAVSDMKSYDYNDANENGFKGYELEAGDYGIAISRNAHEPVETLTYSIASDIRYEKDDATGEIVENRFDDVSGHISTYLSRSDWDGTWPTTPTAAERAVDMAFVNSLNYRIDDEGKPWATDTMPTQSDHELSDKEITVTFKELSGLPYDDPKWEEFMNQLTIGQMSGLIGTGAFGTIPLENLGVPMTYAPDGPSGFTNFMSSGGPVFDTAFYAAECVLGASWNKELAHEFGNMIGDEALIGDNTLAYSGWNAPAVNIHRSPFGGRNWEYYSEDGYLSGAIGAEVVKGCREKGVITYVKHFAVNEQETNRDTNGLVTWADEQAMREIYLKPFEIIVKEGESLGIMSSFNRIGTTWAGGSYALLTEILRDEWGFRGCVVTDYSLPRYMNVNQQIRAGGDLVFNQGDKAPGNDYTPTQVSCMRKAAHNILYAIANSNAVNADILGYLLPIWQVILIVVDVVVLVGLGVWGGLVITMEFRKDKKEEPTEEKTA